MILLPIITALILVAALAWVRTGNGGKFGHHIRRSDWLAWRDAITDKERELQELKSAEPRQ